VKVSASVEQNSFSATYMSITHAESKLILIILRFSNFLLEHISRRMETSTQPETAQHHRPQGKMR